MMGDPSAMNLVTKGVVGDMKDANLATKKARAWKWW
jgi:hypothetical protein